MLIGVSIVFLSATDFLEVRRARQISIAPVASSSLPTFCDFQKAVSCCHHFTIQYTMATVYKSLSKTNGSKDDESSGRGPARKNKQRVLVLSSRGVTYR